MVLKNGLPAINADFLTTSMRNVVGDEQGGIFHALIGTLLITLAATVISVPIGILTAIYLVEYGERSRAARLITFLVDVMTGIPSIVAGLFASRCSCCSSARPTAAASAARSPCPC